MQGMEKLSDHIFTYDYSARIMPGVNFPVRSTLLALDEKTLVIISPGPFAPQVIQAVVNQYQQVFCVAPNAFHHLHVQSFNALFPTIPIYGPELLLAKQPWLRGILQPLQKLDTIVGEQLQFFPIHGNALLDETVFYFPHERTLIVTDLFFNMRKPMPWGRACLLRVVGAHNQLAQSRLIKSSTKDRPAYLQSVRPLAMLNCQRIIVAHGDMVEGESAVRQALSAIGAL